MWSLWTDRGFVLPPVSGAGLSQDEGNQRSLPWSRSPSGHRIQNLLSQGQRAASFFSRATADISDDLREQKWSVSSACLFGLSRHLDANPAP